MRRLSYLILFILLITSTNNKAFALQKSEAKSHMLHDIDMIEHLFEVAYAPGEWKEGLFGLDISRELGRMRVIVSGDEEVSIKRYQQMVKELTFALKDYHVTADFYATEFATLPLNIQSAEERYFITKVLDFHFSFTKGNHLPEVGDEVVAINGVPVKQVFDEFIKKEIGDNVPQTDRALAELYMTHRMSSLGHQVPSGEVFLDLIKKSTSECVTCKTHWSYFKEEVPPPNLLLRSKSAASRRKRSGSSYDKLFITSHYPKKARSNQNPKTGFEYFGSRKGVLPNLGRVLWKTPDDNSFDAYLFELPNGKKAGYVRIATYISDDTETAFSEFQRIVKKMEAEASVLLIDQMNNPGGYVIYLYGLLSHLSPYPLTLPSHRIMLTQEDIYFALNEIDFLEFLDGDTDKEEVIDYLSETLEGVQVTDETVAKVKKYYRLLVDNWVNGKRLTDPIYLYGIEALEPHRKIHFSKPILMLVNSLDFSGGDFMPAILQDNNRALIMGSRTAGAGGYIQEFSYPNLCGVEAFSLTASIAQRTSGRMIENLGVDPDIPYDVSVTDLRDNYSDYKARILEELIKLSM